MDKTKYIIRLHTYPPSVNSAYYHIRSRKGFMKVKTKKARQFIKTIRSFKPEKPFHCPVKVTVFMFISDRRKRDLDNINKILLDSLKKEKQKKYFFEDDDLIHEIHMYKVFSKNPKHKTVVVIEKIDEITTINDFQKQR